MATGSPRTPRLAPEVRQRQLLDAALGIVAAHGVDALTVEAVARAAGVTRPVVYDQFGDLDGLVLALLEREEDVALAPLQWIAAASREDVDPDAFLVDGLRSFLLAVRAAPQTWRIVLMPADGGSPVVRERIRRSRGDVTARVHELLDWGLAARGGPAGLDTALLARLIVAIGEELARLVLAHPRRFSPDRLTTAAAALIAILPRTGAVPSAPSRPDLKSRPGRQSDTSATLGPSRGDGDGDGDGGGAAEAPARVPLAQRRAQLLDEALRLIAEQGFDALNVEALARRAGVNRVTVYRAYATLPVLLLALLKREGGRIDRQLDALLPEVGDPRPPSEQLLGALRGLLDAVLSRPTTWRVALLKPESAPVALQKLAGRRRTELAARLDPLVASGLQGLGPDVGSVDVEVLARLLLTVGEELGRIVLDDPGWPAERLLAEVDALLALLPWR